MEPAPKRKGYDFWTLLLYLLLMCIGVGVVGIGYAIGDYTVLALGVVGVIIPAAICPLIESKTSSPEANYTEIVDLLTSINDRLLLSDQAKSIAYRQKDRDALREAIIEDIREGQYDAALVLVNAMADVFGLREEAEQYRQQIIDAQSAHRRTQVAAAVTDIGRLITARDWEAARRHINRVSRLYPDQPEVAILPARLERAREDHKRQLEREFLRAAEIDDVDRAIELLGELDKYLSAAEAEPFKETARGVIGKKRENLGVQFKLSVQDHAWIDAVNVGETIIRDFPNTKMADEVRSMLDMLRQRAADQRAAESPAR